MVKCPYCARPAMSLARKAGLGPGRAIPCQACGKPVTTHSMAVFTAIPAFAGGLVALKAPSLAISAGAILAGLLLMALVQTFVVPLVRYER